MPSPLPVFAAYDNSLGFSISRFTGLMQRHSVFELLFMPVLHRCFLVTLFLAGYNVMGMRYFKAERH